MDTYLSDNEITEALGISPATLWRWRNRQDRPFPRPIRLGGLNRTAESRLKAYLDGLAGETNDVVEG